MFRCSSMRFLSMPGTSRSEETGRVAATIKTVVARLDRAIQYAAASRFISNASGILGRPVKPGDDSGGVCASA
jgi:hypothetical protein